MSATVYVSHAVGKAVASINPVSLERGQVLVTVSLGGGPYIAFTDPADVEPLIDALRHALELIREAQAELATREGPAGPGSPDQDEANES
jgi:hypothetical protein